MKSEDLSAQLEMWKRALFVAWGAATTMLALALLNAPVESNDQSALFALSLFFLVAVTPPGFILLISRRWQVLPRSARLKTAFGYFAAAWTSLLALIFAKWDELAKTPAGPALAVAAFGLALALWLSYRALRRGVQRAEDIFP
ncbi:MAG: hypothetical protein PVJ07_06495 [Anaerolineales bacterium]|jgi:hypothetical protein